MPECRKQESPTARLEARGAIHLREDIMFAEKNLCTGEDIIRRVAFIWITGSGLSSPMQGKRSRGKQGMPS